MEDRIAAIRLAAECESSFEDQELRTSESAGVTYWEGSVVTDGGGGDKAIRGRGYLEMTGYAGQGMGAILH